MWSYMAVAMMPSQPRVVAKIGVVDHRVKR